MEFLEAWEKYDAELRCTRSKTMHGKLQNLAEDIRREAFRMKAPNPHTPNFVMMAIALEQLAQKIAQKNG